MTLIQLTIMQTFILLIHVKLTNHKKTKSITDIKRNISVYCETEGSI